MTPERISEIEKLLVEGRADRAWYACPLDDRFANGSRTCGVYESWEHEFIADVDDKPGSKSAEFIADCPDIVRELLDALKVSQDALRGYADCRDGCTCGDGWSHDAAREALGMKP